MWYGFGVVIKQERKMDLTTKVTFTLVMLSCMFGFLAASLELLGVKRPVIYFLLVCALISVLGVISSIIFAIWSR